jgi:adenylate cyclase
MTEQPILYVDDEEMNLVTFESAFEDDYRVLTASSGRQALDILARTDVAVVVTDLRMPEMTGVQLLEAIQARHPDTVRMILTGYADIESVIGAVNSGRVHQYITKPWKVDELQLVLDRALDYHRLVRHNQALLAELSQTAARERAIREAFQQFVPKPVVEQLLGGRRRKQFTGELRIVAVLFSDVRGFTPLVAAQPPERIVSFLNRYFARMAEIVTQNHGTVLRYVGDGMLAVFGAPVSTLDNEANAARAALAMIAALDEFNRTVALATVGQPVAIGIGIDRGEVIAANIGSPDRMAYEIVGDCANMASRIQDLTREHPNVAFVSQAVMSRLGDEFVGTSMGSFTLRGAARELEVFRLEPA